VTPVGSQVIATVDPSPAGTLGRRAAYDLCGSLHQLSEFNIVLLFYLSSNTFVSWACVNSRGKYERM